MNAAAGIASVIVAVLIGGWIYSNFIKEEWLGVYESRTSNDIYTIKFKSKETCADWLYDKRMSPGTFTNYECGKNCEAPTTPLGLYRCQETF